MRLIERTDIRIRKECQRKHQRKEETMEEYLALIAAGQGEIVEKKSRFIGYTKAVTTEEEAVSFIESIRKKHYDARHNCFAYSIGLGNQPLLRFSDDGEPQGTAGKPILEVIQGSGVRNLCIVVTRYFGGTLLGTGGLVRAYTEAAKAGLEAGTIRLMRPLIRGQMVLEYTDLGKIQYLIGNTDGEITDTRYTDKVTLTVQIYAPVYDRFEAEVTEASGGRIQIQKTGEIFG